MWATSELLAFACHENVQDLNPSEHGFAKLRLLMEAFSEVCTVCCQLLAYEAWEIAAMCRSALINTDNVFYLDSGQ